MNLKKCVLCGSNEDDAVKFGEFMQCGKQQSVHYYCLLLSSNLVQRGKDDEGILGFLEPDIKKEVKRVLSCKCVYCKKLNANIACCAAKCQRSFHLSCGIKEGCSNMFMGTFQSFCAIHSKFEKIKSPSTNEICVICRDDLGKYRKHLIFRAPCCKSGWFHRWCLAKMALNSGYFFKCPLCNNSEKFRLYAQRRSIYVPNQDAAWEREPNAFADLLERPDTCSAEECRCHNGRKSKGQDLIPCNMCGSKAIHKRCATAPTFTCTECEEILRQSNRKIEEHKDIIHIKNTNDESDEDVDVEIESVTSESNAIERNTPIRREDRYNSTDDLNLYFSDSENGSDNRMNCNKPVNTKHIVPEFSSDDCSTTIDPIDIIFSRIKRKRRATVSESKMFADEKIQRLEKGIHNTDEDSILQCSTSSPEESNPSSKDSSNSINFEKKLSKFLSNINSVEFEHLEKIKSADRRITRSMSLGCRESLCSIESGNSENKKLRPNSCLHFN